MTEDRWFYLRGEEYSAQLDDFITAVSAGKTAADENSFASATQTDQTIAMVIENAQTGETVGEASARKAVAPKKRGWFAR